MLVTPAAGGRTRNCTDQTRAGTTLFTPAKAKGPFQALNLFQMKPLRAGYSSTDMNCRLSSKCHGQELDVAMGTRTILRQAMKTRSVVALVGLAISFALPTFGQQKEMVDPQIVEQLIALGKKFDDAFNNNDAAAVAALFTKDAVLV